jgi:hypothetical protein
MINGYSAMAIKYLVQPTKGYLPLLESFTDRIMVLTQLYPPVDLYRIPLLYAELPAHSRDQESLQTLNDGVHTNTYTDLGHDHGGFTEAAPYSFGSFAMKSSGGPVGFRVITIESSGSHTHTISGSTGTQRQGQPIEMMPPYQTVHYIIRT